MKNFLSTLLAAIVGTFLALFVCGLLIMGLIGSIMAFTEETTPVVPSKAILYIDTSLPLTEQNTDDPFQALQSLNVNIEDTRTLGVLSAVEAVEHAATDPSIEFVLIECKDVMGGNNLVYLEELRKALVDFRESGKAIIAYGDNLSQTDYYLASVADKIYMNDFGTGIFTGMSVNMFFFKDLLDKMGIDVQLTRHGKFKAAAEQFVNSNISDENYTQNKEMLESMWKGVVESISESRGITPDKFNSLVDNLELWNPESFLENNLIDGIYNRTQYEEYLLNLFGVEKERDLAMVSLATYSDATRKINLDSKDKIAVLYANGEIMMEGENILSVKKYSPILREIKNDTTIKALVLRVNSPGGDAQAAEILNNDLKEIQKRIPIVVSMGAYAASGGYWIAANADKIYADNATLTGSIGVFSIYPSLGGAAKELLDINNVSISTNEHSTMLNMVDPLDNKEQAYMQRFVSNVYTDFITLVANGRELPTEYVDSIAQGRVWTGEQAYQLKLVDEIGGLSQALEYAANLVGLEDYRLTELPVVKSSLEIITESLTAAKANVDMFADPYALIKESYKSIKEEKSVRAYARIPYIYEFNY